jgi:hypothetical protein
MNHGLPRARGDRPPGDPLAQPVQRPSPRTRGSTVTGNRWAQAWNHPDARGTGINTKWGKNPEAFKASIKHCEASGYHPRGCDSIKSVADHEFGHMLDYLLNLSVDNEVRALYRKAMQAGIRNEVSEYAGKKISEFIAECWAESCNSPAPRPTARSVAMVIRERYRSRYLLPDAAAGA